VREGRAITEISSGLWIVLISVHGLIRGRELELGRDADTGGQIKYVVELARALAQAPGVAQVDLLTRRVEAPEIDPDYGQPEERLGEGVRVLRIEAGPAGYLPKEALWDHLDTFADNALTLLREQGGRPDLIHSHYADAGYVGTRMAHQLGVPLIHTGHSLGRVKRRRLLAAGLDRGEIEASYNMRRRVEAEEDTLASAELVITSTHQEIEEQYGLYDHYRPEVMRVLPPGTDLGRFYPPEGGEWDSAMAAQLARFLREPRKPMILALSRPDPRKNIGALVTAYGESPELQACANLIIVAGNRDDIVEMEAGSRTVLSDILLAIDRYDLYGRVAFPKHHSADDVPLLYRIAAASHGVFVNPALTEPFGLTLIEAAASGLPVVATEDGGPRDILGNCENGLLVDPLDSAAIAKVLLEVLRDRAAWGQRAASGIRGVREHYSWPSHARRYLELVRPLLERVAPPPAPVRRQRKLYHDRAIFSDLDQNLLGNPSHLPQFARVIRENRKCATFGIATGRRLDSALKAIRRYGLPEPDVLITSGGTEIHYAPSLTEDSGWRRHIDYLWTPTQVRHCLDALPGLQLQPKTEQHAFKISYYMDPSHAPGLEEIRSLLHKEELSVNLTFSFGQFLDVLPIRASKGYALRYWADRWDVPLEQILVAGGSGADEDMMRGNTLAVVVANRHHEELQRLGEIERLYYAKRPYAEGILEAIEHYGFFDACRLQEPES